MFRRGLKRSCPVGTCGFERPMALGDEANGVLGADGFADTGLDASPLPGATSPKTELSQMPLGIGPLAMVMARPIADIVACESPSVISRPLT